MSDTPGSSPPGGDVPPPPGHPPSQPPPPGYPPPPQPGYAPPPQPGYAPPGYQPYGAPGYPPYQPPMGNPAMQFGPLAGFGVRLGAYLLDSLLYGLLSAIALVPGIIALVAAFDDCTTIDGEVFCDSDDFDAGALVLALGVMFVWFLVVAFIYLRALATSGQTWGRRIVDIKVINEQTGTPPGWGKAIGRSAFAAFISAQIFYIGYLWMLWDDKKQTLHDKVAGTHVISTRR